MMGWSPRCYIPSFVKVGPPVLEKKIFESFFYHIWAWRPSWSCDLDAANKLPLPLPKEAPRKILALIGQAVLEKKVFEIVDDDDGRMPEHGHPKSSP